MKLLKTYGEGKGEAVFPSYFSYCFRLHYCYISSYERNFKTIAKNNLILTAVGPNLSACMFLRCIFCVYCVNSMWAEIIPLDFSRDADALSQWSRGEWSPRG